MKGMTRQLIIYKISIAGEVILFLITRKPLSFLPEVSFSYLFNLGKQHVIENKLIFASTCPFPRESFQWWQLIKDKKIRKQFWISIFFSPYLLETVWLSVKCCGGSSCPFFFY